MTHRIFGILVTIAWLVMLGLLMQRDVIPFWRAQDPPASTVPNGDFQTAILKENGRRIGTGWVTTLGLSEMTTVHALTVLDVSGMLPVLKNIRLQSTLSYNKDNDLDEFLFSVHSNIATAVVTGERYDREFACIAQIGPIKRQISLDARLSAYMSDSMKPFTHLRGLTVGQTWRMRVLDPFALMRGEEARFNVQLVRVTKRETIEHRGQPVECFRIETERTVAWANDEGRVIRQEVAIPFLGTWIMVDEPYDDAARQAAKNPNGRQEQSYGKRLHDSAKRLIDDVAGKLPDLKNLIQNRALRGAQTQADDGD